MCSPSGSSQTLIVKNAYISSKSTISRFNMNRNHNFIRFTAGKECIMECSWRSYTVLIGYFSVSLILSFEYPALFSICLYQHSNPFLT